MRFITSFIGTRLPTLGGKKKAFSLLEMIVVLAIVIVILLTVIQLMLTLLQTRGRTEASAELQQRTRYAFDRILERTRNSTRVLAASTGLLSLGSGAYLGSLRANPPTVFYLADNTIYMVENQSITRRLLPETITVTSLQFTDRTATPGPQIVEMSITASISDATGHSDSISWTTAAALRQ